MVENLLQLPQEYEHRNPEIYSLLLMTSWQGIILGLGWCAVTYLFVDVCVFFLLWACGVERFPKLAGRVFYTVASYSADPPGGGHSQFTKSLPLSFARLKLGNPGIRHGNRGRLP